MGDERYTDFLAHKHARAGDLGTPKEAAISMMPSADQLCGRILQCLKDHGPQTFEQAAKRLNLYPSQVWKRLSDLKSTELIEPAGTMIGSTRRQQTLWKAK